MNRASVLGIAFILMVHGGTANSMEDEHSAALAMYAELFIDVELEGACIRKVNAISGKNEVVASDYCINEVNDLRDSVYQTYGTGILLEKVDSFIRDNNIPTR